MLAVVSLSLALQVTTRPPQTREDSLRLRRDSVAVMIEEAVRTNRRDRRPPRRDSVTPELLATAFRDSGARELLYRARLARLRQDSTLQSYDARSYQRISMGMGFRAIGRNRLLFRTETAARVRWSRTGGAFVDLTGQRSVAPALAGTDAEIDMDLDMSPLPYYPGREELWIGGDGLARAEVDDRDLVHPIATGSEAYYRYASGDSLIFTLPDGARITLRELRVEPRRPEWRLSVGSFWFDAASGQLVRAVYRFSAPMDIWAVASEESRRARAGEGGGGVSDLAELQEDDDVPGWVKGLLSPLKANLEAVTIEYGLYGGRFWLPRTQFAEATAQASFIRVPVRIEESFTYASVNGPEAMPSVAPPSKALRDSLFPDDTGSWRDLPAEERRARNRAIARAAADRAQARALARRQDCDATGHYTREYDRYEGTLRMAVRVPCDSTVLIHSPDLAESIYDPGEELFGTAQRDELLKALDFGLQSAWAPQRPQWQHGLSLTRYNRVEGLSTGLTGSMNLGRGYTLDGGARLGTGDWWPNADLGLARSNGRTTWRIGGYQRLQSMSEWGAPFSFGASLGALLFGRDDGFYYRTQGVALQRGDGIGGVYPFRLFAERHQPAEVNVSFNLARAMGTPSRFRENIAAQRGQLFGASLRDVRSLGLNPQGWRFLSDLRLEGGWFAPTGVDTTEAGGYGRAALDLTLSRGLGDRAGAAVTIGAGVSGGAPVQRQFILGGAETVRGQRPGAGIGESYWLGRLELGRGISAGRLVAFGDVGWAGPRDLWSTPGRAMSGAGVGLSLLDGMIRADLARGIYPSTRLRFDLYLEARF